MTLRAALSSPRSVCVIILQDRGYRQQGEESPPTGCFLTGHNCSNDSKQRCVADSKPGDAGAQVSSTGMTLVRTFGCMYTVL